MKVKTHMRNVFAKLKHSSFLNVASNEKYRRFEDLNELVSLENQVKTVRLQDKLGKQNFHEDMKKVFEPVSCH